MSTRRENKEMAFTVEYMRYFEEFGWNDFDTEEFDNLKDAYARYNELKETTETRLLVDGQRIH